MKPMFIDGYKNQTGVSLIEVMVSVLILGVGLLGIAAMQAAALRNNEGAYGRSQAVIQSYNIIEAMRANRGGVLAGDYNMALTCTAPAGTGTLASADWNAWITAMKAELGDTDNTCGAVQCADDTCTVTVQWDDSIGTHADAAAITAAETRTFTTVTRI
ncbi:MAG: type IV pilus modification protein PilV [Pseudomonadota bacterium]|nr:type IV pilus modification protein PilV [Pseudomonadota bacterium]